MRATDSPDHIVIVLARNFILGSLAGLALLAVCLLENIADLGYAVLAGGLWALMGLIGAFGLAFGCGAVAILLAAASLSPSAPVLGNPAHKPRWAMRRL